MITINTNNDLYNLYVEAQKNDECSMYELFIKFQRLIIKLANFAGYEEAGTDLTIFFIELVRKLELDKFSDATIGQLINYTIKSLKNKAINLKKKHMNKMIKISFDEVDLFLSANDCYKSLDKFDLQVLLNNLTDLQRKIMICIYVYSYSVSELSSKLNISRQAVNQNKLRALSIIKKNIEGGEYTNE